MIQYICVVKINNRKRGLICTDHILLCFGGKWERSVEFSKIHLFFKRFGFDFLDTSNPQKQKRVYKKRKYDMCRTAKISKYCISLYGIGFIIQLRLVTKCLCHVFSSPPLRSLIIVWMCLIWCALAFILVVFLFNYLIEVDFLIRDTSQSSSNQGICVFE